MNQSNMRNVIKKNLWISEGIKSNASAGKTLLMSLALARKITIKILRKFFK